MIDGIRPWGQGTRGVSTGGVPGRAGRGWGWGPPAPPLAGVSERARCPEGGVTAYGGQQESRPPWLSRLRDESGHRGVVWVGLLAPRAELARRARATLGCLPAVFPAPVWGKPDLGRHGGFAAPRPRRRTAATCAWCRGGLPAPTDRLIFDSLSIPTSFFTWIVGYLMFLRATPKPYWSIISSSLSS